MMQMDIEVNINTTLRQIKLINTPFFLDYNTLIRRLDM